MSRVREDASRFYKALKKCGTGESLAHLQRVALRTNSLAVLGHPSLGRAEGRETFVVATGFPGVIQRIEDLRH